MVTGLHEKCTTRDISNIEALEYRTTLVTMSDSLKTTEFVRLWTLHGQRIYAYLVILTSNHADADEIFQEVGISLWKKFDQFTPGTNFQAWARKIAFNRVRNFRRLHYHQTLLCSPRFLETIDQRISKRSSILDAQHDALIECFEKLPPRQKDLIDRRYQPGATPASVAKQTGRNTKAIYQALWRIHNSLFRCVRKATLGEGIS